MLANLGETRSKVKGLHALICPDSHEVIDLPHWPGTDFVSFVTPALGATFSLSKITAFKQTRILPPPHKGTRFFLVQNGTARLNVDNQNSELSDGHFAFLPPDCDHSIELAKSTELLCLERPYTPTQSAAAPGFFTSSIKDIVRTKLKGDDGLHIQKLLPSNPGFDMEINVMDFAPGATLPYVETHFMEHGLMMLSGGGVYRLEDDWYPVTSGDVIWMGPFCPQWFGALGRENARYLIYKNWNRDPLVC